MPTDPISSTSLHLCHVISEPALSLVGSAGPPRRAPRSQTPPAPRLILPSPRVVALLSRIRAAAPAAGGCDLSALISSSKTTLSLLLKDLLVLHSFGLVDKAALVQLGLDQGEARRRIRDRVPTQKSSCS